MTRPFVLLFVESPEASAGFYGARLGREPVELSPTFALFSLEGGAMLGLWSRATAEPRPTGAPGSSELALAVDTADEVDSLAAEWAAAGTPILQAPTSMDFGRTFLAADPDGHRLRVFAPA